jgi:hypothetical protein
LLASIDQQDKNDGEILDQVKLIFFKAEPANIGSFGSSILSWKVEGPDNVTIRLGLLDVDKVGERVVQPANTTSFSLSARHGSATRPLGNVQVRVATQDCETIPAFANARSSLEAFLKLHLEQRLKDDPEIYIRSRPVVNITPGRIRFQLFLRARRDWSIDPFVDIVASFGLRVTDGTIVAIREQTSASIYLKLPFGKIEVGTSEDREKAHQKAHETIEGMTQFIDAQAAISPPLSKRVQVVRIGDGNNGAGEILVTKCPDDLLRRFAVISELEPPIF